MTEKDLQAMFDTGHVNIPAGTVIEVHTPVFAGGAGVIMQAAHVMVKAPEPKSENAVEPRTFQVGQSVQFWHPGADANPWAALIVAVQDNGLYTLAVYMRGDSWVEFTDVPEGKREGPYFLVV